MNIFIDESGSFALDSKPGRWNVVAALVTTESQDEHVISSLRDLKESTGVSSTHELKLKDISESDYVRLLERVYETGAVLHAVATDSSWSRPELVRTHRLKQSALVRANLPRMLHCGGREGVQLLADEIDGLSEQLYAQLVVQAQLIEHVVRLSVVYYALREPQTLGSFKWRIDQKDWPKSTFERVFERLTPGVLQAMSAAEPFALVSGADYRYFLPFLLSPHYREGGTEPRPSGIDIGKLFRSDLKSVDSRTCPGVQVVDLLATGLRKCLRGSYANNLHVAKSLGRLMVQAPQGGAIPRIVSLSAAGSFDEVAMSVMSTFNEASRSKAPRANQ